MAQFFYFKKFTLDQENSPLKICTDSCLFGAWVAQQINQEKSLTLLDIGTGIGLLSFIIGSQHPKSKILGVEIIKHVYKLALKNLELNSNLFKNIEFILGDINQISLKKKFDIIISNPPFYINDLPKQDINSNIALHQKLLNPKQLICQFKKYLVQSGNIFFMIPPKNFHIYQTIIQENNLYINAICQIYPYTKGKVIRLFIKVSTMPSVIKSTSIAIKQDKIKEAKYTEEAIELLKPLYMNW